MTNVQSGWLAHPATRGLDLDDPAVARARVAIIRGKPILRDVYAEWYEALAAAVPPGRGGVLELGSGAGFLRDRVPGAITSDVAAHPGVRVVVDGTALPFGDGTLRSIVMTDVLHHIARPGLLFAEMSRAVRSGGTVAMIEPWLSTWSRWLYSRAHHEPCEPATPRWEFDSTGPLSGANLALPWIIFARDAATFAREFPQWRVAEIRPLAGMRYLAAGGVSLRSLVPAATLPAWRWVDRSLERWPASWSMFAVIVLTRTGAPAAATR